MKVLLTATVQSHICQFHKPLVDVLHEHGCEVHVAARDNLAEKNGLKLDFVDRVYDVPFARSPKSLDNIKAYKQLKHIIDQGDYDVIHCNTPMGGIVTRLAARAARKHHGTKVFYTAHGFHFYQGAPKKNWIVFYPIEKIFAHYFTDKLITITGEDYKLAKRKFHCKIERIHGVGVDEKRYHPVPRDNIGAMLLQEQLSKEDYTILCVGELNTNKNQETLLKAAARLTEEIPRLRVLLAGNGPKEADIKRQIQELQLGQTVRLLGYRTDLEKITSVVNLVVSCSYREGLPLNILEAMLCKKSVIVSRNRGHKELVENKKTGYLFTAGDVERLAGCILHLYHNRKLTEQMGEAGYKKAMNYTAVAVSRELENIYFNS